MFDRPHHRRIEHLLRSLNAGLLREHACYFGGGTAIALRYGEYRESVDVDFVVSQVEGYRALRRLVDSATGIHALAAPGQLLEPARELRADSYGLHTALRVDGVNIKFEIIREGRIELETPGSADQVAGITTLTALDMATTKLLANCDRWADDAAHSRDLIDLAMMSPSKVLLKQAIAKAAVEYGDSVERDLGKAIAALLERPGWLERCMAAMAMQAVPRALLWKRLQALRPKPQRA